MASLPYGSTIGIVGGGQLGRMLAMAAARLGYRTVILDPDPECPAAQCARSVIAAEFGDAAALAELAEQSCVVTYEFENVPVEPLRSIQGSAPVFPPPDALEVAQDRVLEKAFLNGLGIATAEWRAVDDLQELDHALQDLGGPCLLKTRRFGYDGKAQVSLDPSGDHQAAFEALGRAPCILERKCDLASEVSVIAARAEDGRFVHYEPAANVHENGILATSTVPSGLPAEIVAKAGEATRLVTERLGYVGVIGVEFFVTKDGALLANEMAPRVHNSGHWTEAACPVSQFEQHIRAVAGLPLGGETRHSDCVMRNILGEDIETAFAHLSDPNAVLHLYGKKEARPGRKMGHVTHLAPRP